jgi:hypothetical protein
MNDQDQASFEPRIADWLEGDANEAPDQVLQIVLAAFPSVKQRHALRLPRRFPDVTTVPKLAFGTVAVIAVVLGGAFVLSPGALDGGAIGRPSPSPSPTASPSPAPSATAGPSSAPSASATIDTAAWTTYVSKQYGFTIGHPADWSVDPASRAWTWKDASKLLNNGQDSFDSADGHVRVSAWSVPIKTSTGTAPLPDVEAWVSDWCKKAGDVPCAGIHERAVPLCNERRDCHPGLLVPFDEDVLAFFTGGTSGDNMLIVAVWWGDSAPAVASYGGSRRLLEGFISTMCVWPEDARPPFDKQIPGC